MMPEATRIIPAYAGSTILAGTGQRRRGDHPRIRGEHANPPEQHRRHPGSSPHTRGAPPERVLADGPGGIIPAYAGSTFSVELVNGELEDHPRIRGEHQVLTVPGDAFEGSSPHTRGARRRRARYWPWRGIIPAYAGSTPAPRNDPRPGRDHPRIRGEHQVLTVPGDAFEGSSPHTRGARRRRARYWPWRGIIPAYAGSTCTSTRQSTDSTDHPRIRGEHKWKPKRGSPTPGSSPHTRGAHVRGGRGAGIQRIIPAYAGSTPSGTGTRFSGRDHPRIRGEHRSDTKERHHHGGSSPHTRGARPGSSIAAAGLRIIPAYAGSTKEETKDAGTKTDHPRIRGEHPIPEMTAAPPRRSSPHTRGAPTRGD